MTATVLESWKEQFQAADVELSLASQSKDEKNPFQHHYAARKILQDIYSEIDQYLDISLTENLPTIILVASAILDLKLGINFIETDEISTGQKCLEKCIEKLKVHQLHSDCVSVIIQSYNQMGILQSNRNNYEEGIDFLVKAELLYIKFKDEVGKNPSTVDDIFTLQHDELPTDTLETARRCNFEEVHTHTLYYIAQVYSKMGRNDESAKYCQITLQRQLSSMKYDPIDWSLNAATLSQYHVTNDNFPMARHCLAASSCILSETKDSVPDDENDKSLNEDELPRALADLSRCWIKYGLALLEKSKEKLMGNLVNINPTKILLDQKTATLFNLEVTCHEEQVSCEWIEEVNSAKNIFIFIVKKIEEAKEYYAIDIRCPDYVELVQDHSSAYRLLSFYEPDFERQCKMTKRRIDMLTKLIKQLNPQHYLLVCRQLIYEAAEAYSALLDLKLAIIESSGKPASVYAMEKINKLAKEAIEQYITYLGTLQEKSCEILQKFDEDNERPAVVAYLAIGRLYGKLISSDRHKRVHFLQMSTEYYKNVVDYCDKFPSALAELQMERDICKEMIELLPIKMSKIC